VIKQLAEGRGNFLVHGLEMSRYLQGIADYVGVLVVQER
jgi:hypothetical protein